MAKKRKEGETEEEQDFQLPKFDEEAFIKRERRNIKTLFISFLLGLLLSLICFGFWTLLSKDIPRFELVLLVGVVNSIWLKYIFVRLNIDLEGFGRKGWATSFATYFFTWLLILIILVNPPFYDDEPPRMEVAVLPGMQEPGGTVQIVALIQDNVDVTKQGITFSIEYPDGTNDTPQFTFEHNILRYTYENPTNLIGTYQYTVTATDVNGRMQTPTIGTFAYSNVTLQITSSIIPNIQSGDKIIINADESISTENFLVSYQINNGTAINVNRSNPSEKEEYETSPKYQGWTANQNQTMHVYAEVSHYFLNVNESFTNTIEDTTTYLFSTGSDPRIGTETPPTATGLNYVLPQPKYILGTPGFELVTVLLAFIIVVLFFKRKKKDTKP